MKIYNIILLIFFINCFSGGFIEKGGHVDNIYLFNQATNIYTNDYYIICLKNKSINQEELEQESFDITKEIEYVPKNSYKGGCEQYGEASQFYLFHLFPISGKIDPEYAINLAVQKLEGDTMIHIRSWHETHYYSILGQVRVFKVKGDVIKFQIPTIKR